jgi:hypothetical protein
VACVCVTMDTDVEPSVGGDDSLGKDVDAASDDARENVEASVGSSSSGPPVKPLTPPPVVQSLDDWAVPILVVKDGDEAEKRSVAPVKWRGELNLHPSVDESSGCLRASSLHRALDCGHER